MTDYIERQAALDALGELPLVWTEDDYYSLGARNQYDGDRLAIETIPSADVEPVVRCKDCIFGYKYFDVINGITDSWVECRNPEGLNRDVSCDGYCSEGIYGNYK